MQWRSRKTAWEAVLDMERYSCNVKEMDQGVFTLVVDLAKAFGKVQIQNVVSLGNALRFAAVHLASPLCVFSAPEKGAL